MKSIPISKVCPSCGAAEFRKVRAKRWIAFSDDRICLSCNTRYALPTPLWAGVAFVVMGVIIFLGGALLMVGGVATLLRGMPDLLGLAIAAGLLILGVAAGIHGVRALFFRGSV
jgi:hypothetical protein